MGQRVYGRAVGYEDLNDHEQLRRQNPLPQVLAGKARKRREQMDG
ncbi:MAG TPA: hypothetical protein VG345_12945 [Bryobacteraceae bacterium]|nr:hypothetical protein [Bryobacteraceae bacterium]